MSTLLLRLVGPMQSWGTTSRFDERDTGKEPSKSGVVGLLAAAMGIDRANWKDLEPLTKFAMGVRHDRSGSIKRDYQTAGCSARDTIIKADGTQSKAGGVVSQRFYLADAAFLVGLECEDRSILERAYAALGDPFWSLALGRKSYVPSEPIWIKGGLRDTPLRAVLIQWPWIGTLRKWETEPPARLLIACESDDGSGTLHMDQPLSSFDERKFGARFVRSEWVDRPQEVAHAPA